MLSLLGRADNNNHSTQSFLLSRRFVSLVFVLILSGLYTCTCKFKIRIFFLLGLQFHFISLENTALLYSFEVFKISLCKSVIYKLRNCQNQESSLKWYMAFLVKEIWYYNIDMAVILTCLQLETNTRILLLMWLRMKEWRKSNFSCSSHTT